MQDARWYKTRARQTQDHWGNVSTQQPVRWDSQMFESEIRLLHIDQQYKHSILYILRLQNIYESCRKWKSKQRSGEKNNISLAQTIGPFSKFHKKELRFPIQANTIIINIKSHKYIAENLFSQKPNSISTAYTKNQPTSCLKNLKNPIGKTKVDALFHSV